MMPFRRYREWQQGEFVLCFADTSSGGKDYCAAQFLSHKWLDVPLVYHSHITSSMMTPLLRDELESIFEVTGVRPIVAFERNNGGAFEMDRLDRLNRYNNYIIYTMKSLNPYGKITDTGRLGWDTTGVSRPKMLQELKDAIDGLLIHLYDRPTLNELFSFVIKKNGKAEAEENAHDDLVMALAGVFQLYQTEKPDSDQEGGVIETVSNSFAEAGVININPNVQRGRAW